jgi:1-deoxy-D-xylulose-5-phosphate synthase
VEAALELKDEGLNPAVFDMRFVKPLDEELLHDIFSRFGKVITVEDGCLMGGFGSAILEFAADNQFQAVIKRLGIPDEIIEHGEQPQLHEECGYNKIAIKEAIVEMTEIYSNTSP